MEKCERRLYLGSKYQILREFNWPLEFGSAIHEVLAEFDINRPNSLEIAVKAGVDKAIEIGSNWPQWRYNNKYSLWQLIKVPVWYGEKYKDDSLFKLKFRPELEFSLALPNGLDYIGRFDAIVEAMGQNYIFDRKSTGSTLGDQFFSRYSPDIQFSAYIWVGRKLWPELKIAGVICEGIQIAAGWIDFERALIVRSKEEIEEFESTLIYDSERRLHLEGKEMKYWLKKEASCFGCPFRGFCAAPEAKRQSYRILPRDGE